MVTIFKVSPSVILLPSTIVCATPNVIAKLVANFPPPCTKIAWPSSLEKAVRKFVNITGLSTILPPILITYNFSIKYFPSICLLPIIFPTTPLVLPKLYWTLLWSPNYLDHLIFRRLTPHFFSLADSASLLHD